MQGSEQKQQPGALCVWGGVNGNRDLPFGRWRAESLAEGLGGMISFLLLDG